MVVVAVVVAVVDLYNNDNNLLLGSHEHGKFGNLCHVDCSNRGICNYRTGLCTCFPGSWGDNCAQVSNAGGYSLKWNQSSEPDKYYFGD